MLIVGKELFKRNCAGNVLWLVSVNLIESGCDLSYWDENDDGERMWIHPALVLHPSCVPEKVGINQKGVNKKYSRHK
jgi:hypothetical protein